MQQSTQFYSNLFSVSDLARCRVTEADALNVGDKVIRVYYHLAQEEVCFDVYAVESEIFFRTASNRQLPSITLNCGGVTSDFFLVDLGIESPKTLRVWSFSYSDRLLEYLRTNQQCPYLLEVLDCLNRV